MPTYAYRREDGSEFDHFQKMSDQPLQTCPTTGQLVTRMISGGAGVVYKGSGWYVKEYKNTATLAKPEKEKTAPATTAPEAPKATCAHNDCSCT